ncbi:hypothetical protein MRX96_007253 [Rhipicephalus microplus]
MHRKYPETYQTDKCKVCWRKTADHTHILWDCIKHTMAARSRTMPSRLDAAAKSYDQGEQLWALQQVLGALERQGPSEPATASGDSHRVTATPTKTVTPRRDARAPNCRHKKGDAAMAAVFSANAAVSASLG